MTDFCRIASSWPPCISLVHYHQKLQQLKGEARAASADLVPFNFTINRAQDLWSSQKSVFVPRLCLIKPVNQKKKIFKRPSLLKSPFRRFAIPTPYLFKSSILFWMCCHLKKVCRLGIEPGTFQSWPNSDNHQTTTSAAEVRSKVTSWSNKVSKDLTVLTENELVTALI